MVFDEVNIRELLLLLYSEVEEQKKRGNDDARTLLRNFYRTRFFVAEGKFSNLPAGYENFTNGFPK
jgi:hypothetical protein